MAEVTTLTHVLTVLGVTDSEHVRQAYRSAEAAQAAGCRWSELDATGMPLFPPEDLIEAVVLRTARYLARRESPSGVIGVGEFGPVRISSIDRDIEELEAPYRVVRFG